MGMRAHLTVLSADEAAAVATWSGDEMTHRLFNDDVAIGIDKSWEAAFPLIGDIAGTGMMLTDNVMPVGDDLGYGPAMMIDPDEVAKIAAALEGIDDSAATERLGTIESPFMAPGLYDDDEGRAFGIGGFRATADLFADAASRSSAVLFAIL